LRTALGVLWLISVLSDSGTASQEKYSTTHRVTRRQLENSEQEITAR
jgi:hypothetical protein